MSSLAEARELPRVVEARESDPIARAERLPSGESDVLVGQTLDGRYRIDTRIGEGGLGSVYRAHHLKLERSVAVKVLRSELRGVPEIRQRFEREVRTLSSLSHPNIVTITDYGDERGMPYLVMELAEGKELNVLAKEGLHPARAIDIARQILSSLAYAHGREIVHRDLKPANIIIRPMPDGRDHVVVLDFGLAKFVGDDSSGHDLTRSGLVVGTPAYLPPEQLGGGSKKADGRSDLYAVGLVLFEMLTGRRPFLGEDAADVLRAHLVSTPPTLAEACPGATVSPALERIVERALAKAPADRFQTARSMLDALEALPPVPMRRPGLTRDPTQPVSSIEIDVPVSRTAAPPPRTNVRWALIAAATACAVTFGLGVRFGSGGSPPEAPTVPEIASAAAAAGGTALDGVSSGVEAVAAALPPAPTLEGLTGAIAPVLGGDPTEVPLDGVLAGGADVAAVEGETVPTAEDGEIVADPTAEPSVAFTVPAERPRARNPWTGPRIPAVLSRYHRIVERRDLSRTELRVLTRYRNEHSSDARVRLLIGHAFVRLGWLTDALAQYERALELDLSMRGDPDLVANLLRLTRFEPLSTRAADVVVAAYGAEASSATDRAIERERDEPSRARLEALRARLPAE